MDVFNEIRGHLQELDASHRAMVRDIDTMQKGLEGLRVGVNHAHESITALTGTFASIEGMLAANAAEIASIKAQLSDTTARVNALEKRAS
ncbi:MAG: hypothetical protein ACYCW6_13280 [Candidatus Xenobia bacterium]